MYVTQLTAHMEHNFCNLCYCTNLLNVIPIKFRKQKFAHFHTADRAFRTTPIDEPNLRSEHDPRVCVLRIKLPGRIFFFLRRVRAQLPHSQHLCHAITFEDLRRKNLVSWRVDGKKQWELDRAIIITWPP